MPHWDDLAFDLESIPFPVSMTDGENRFVRVNRAFERMYGWRQAELIGQSPRMLTPQDVSETFLRRLDRATAAGGWHGRLLNRTRTGRKFETFLATHTLHPASAAAPSRLGMACRAGNETALLAALLQALAESASPKSPVLPPPPLPRTHTPRPQAGKAALKPSRLIPSHA